MSKWDRNDLSHWISSALDLKYFTVSCKRLQQITQIVLTQSTIQFSLHDTYTYYSGFPKQARIVKGWSDFAAHAQAYKVTIFDGPARSGGLQIPPKVYQ